MPETGSKSTVKTHETEIISGIKVIESEYRVERPVFEDVKIQRAVFEEKKINIPVGFEEVASEIAEVVAKKIVEKMTERFDQILDKVITNRVKEVEVPKIIHREEVNVIKKDVEV